MRAWTAASSMEGRAVRPRSEGQPIQQLADDDGDVLPALAQGGNPDGEDVQPVVQILAELALGHHLPQIPVGGGEDPGLDGDLLLPANPKEGPGVEEGEQLRLEEQVQLADLVEQEGALVGQLQHPALAPPWCRVNAPGSWPNSSDSASSLVRAAQLMVKNGPSARAELLWIQPAMKSLPEPLSPSRSTRLFCLAALEARLNSLRVAGSG